MTQKSFSNGYLLILVCTLSGAMACGGSGSEDAGMEVRDTGAEADTGPGDSGPEDSGPADTGPTDLCVGVDCSGLTDTCNQGVCDPETGMCMAEPRMNGTRCDDGSLCTLMDRCRGGVCTGEDRDCSTANDMCNVGVCDPMTGSCTGMPVTDGTDCDDSDVCTSSDVCTAGVCAGESLDCSALDDTCRAGTCDSSTGECVAEVVPDRTACDDMNACTIGEMCISGRCTEPTSMVDCSALTDACHAGMCDPSTGTCVATPAADGTPCDDADTCTSNTTCTAGTCGGGTALCFGVSTLTSTGCRLVEHNSLSGDDRGGIGITSRSIMYTGDLSTAVYNLDLGSGTSVGERRDSLIGNFATGDLYVLASARTEINRDNFRSAEVTRLLPVTASGAIGTSGEVTLSTPISLPVSGTRTGIFSGWNRAIVHNGNRAFAIELPSGTVTDLGAMSEPTRRACENWAYWGIAEFDGTNHSVVLVQDANTIVRVQVPSGTVRSVASFSTLSDMCSITFSPANNRWYFHYEGFISTFGTSGSENLGFCDATFTNAP